MTDNQLTIGVLALQGDYDAHRQTLNTLGVGTVLVVLGVAVKWPQIRRLGALQETRAEPVQTNK